MNLAHLEIIAVARSMLDGEKSFIEGARQITALRNTAGLDYLDPDIVPFVVIDSETDKLPFGDVRKLWAPAALEKLQPEIDRKEQWARETGASHCRNLIDRLRRPDEPPIKDGADFWLRLGRRMTEQMWMSGDNNLRFLWVDGAVPDALLSKLDEALVLVWMLVSEDSGKSFAEYRVSVHLDPARIESYRSARWAELLPNPEATGWLTVRRDAKEMDVRLGASKDV